MAYGKKNKVKIDPFSYNIGLLGEPGIGKTTIIKEMCEKNLGEDGYLFVECGKEDGADGCHRCKILIADQPKKDPRHISASRILLLL